MKIGTVNIKDISSTKFLNMDAKYHLEPSSYIEERLVGHKNIYNKKYNPIEIITNLKAHVS